PAFCAFFTFTTNVHAPRSITAILPASEPTIGSQASVVVPTPSFTTTAAPLTPPSVSAAPNDAAFAASEPGANGTATSGAWARNGGAAVFTSLPSHTRWFELIAEATRWVGVIWSQWRPDGSSSRKRSHTAGNWFGAVPRNAPDVPLVVVLNPRPCPNSCR